MFFALLDEINFAEGAGVGHFFDFEIFRSEEEFFAVHEEDAGFFCGGDHLFAFGDGHGERLFADDVLADGGGVFGHLAMEAVGRADADDFDGGIFEHFAVVGVGARDVEALGEMFGVAGSGGGDGDEFGFVGHDLERGGMDVGLELGADDADFYFFVCGHCVWVLDSGLGKKNGDAKTLSILRTWGAGVLRPYMFVIVLATWGLGRRSRRIPGGSGCLCIPFRRGCRCWRCSSRAR